DAAGLTIALEGGELLLAVHEGEERPGLFGGIGIGVDHEAGAARDGDEILAAIALARGLGRHRGPTDLGVAVIEPEFAARRQHRVEEPVALDQQRRLAVAEIGEAAVAAVPEQLGALVAEPLVDIDSLVEVEGIENALALDDIIAVFVDD